jgi:hypothetical protein
VTAGAKGITGDRHGAYETLQATVIFLSSGREAEGAVGQTIAKTKSFGGSVREKLNAHADVAFRGSETITRPRAIFCFQAVVVQPHYGTKAGERPKKESPVGPRQERSWLWR